MQSAIYVVLKELLRIEVDPNLFCSKSMLLQMEGSWLSCFSDLIVIWHIVIVQKVGSNPSWFKPSCSWSSDRRLLSPPAAAAARPSPSSCSLQRAAISPPVNIGSDEAKSVVVKKLRAIFWLWLLPLLQSAVSLCVSYCEHSHWCKTLTAMIFRLWHLKSGLFPPAARPFFCSEPLHLLLPIWSEFWIVTQISNLVKSFCSSWSLQWATILPPMNIETDQAKIEVVKPWEQKYSDCDISDYFLLPKLASVTEKQLNIIDLCDDREYNSLIDDKLFQKVKKQKISVNYLKSVSN